MTFEDLLRSLGGVLQTVGVLTVAYELHRAHRRYLERPTRLERLGHRIRRALRRVFRRRPTGGKVQAVGPAGTVAMAGKVRAVKWRSHADQLDLEEKVQELLRRTDQLREGQDLLRHDLREFRHERIETANDLLRRQREAERRLDAAIRDVATGSLRVRWWGVALLVPGIVLTTWAAELAEWLT